ncbi:MAG: lamin tail domain-containing protein, partial [Planctomycetales bacterium]|nr:lamin tail domain-containing protein [Planctomycetales bacterium]
MTYPVCKRRIRSRRCLTHEPLENRELLASDVVISEFLADNEANLKNDVGEFSDWIEIQNRSANAVNLEGWYLTDSDNNLTKWQFPSVTLAGGGYLLVYASGDNRTTSGVPLHTNFRLNNAGEFLALVEPDGTTIASAFAPEYPPQSADVSYGLSPDGTQTGYFSTPTPNAANSDPESDPARRVMVTEIMYHPASENSVEEFVELHNSSDSPINLNGWRLSGGIDFDFGDFSIPAHGYAVVAADVDTFVATYGDGILVTGPWTGQLSNQSDRISIRDADDLRVDLVEYADEGDWSIRERGPDDLGT